MLEASAFLKANYVPRPTDMIEDCAKLIILGWSRVPREDEEAVCPATPRFVFVQRVIEGCHNPWQGSAAPVARCASEIADESTPARVLRSVVTKGNRYHAQQPTKQHNGISSKG